MKLNYYLQLDLLKAFAMISVLIIHSYDSLISKGNHLETNVSINLLSIANTLVPPSYIKFNGASFLGIIEIVKVFTLWQAVPIFFIVMGITLGLSFKRKNFT